MSERVLSILITKPEDFPSEPHFQIWIQRTYSEYTGYEETHGSSSSKRWVTYAYLDKEEWEKEMIRLVERNAKGLYSKEVFLGFQAGPKAKIKTSISIDIDLRS